MATEILRTDPLRPEALLTRSLRFEDRPPAITTAKSENLRSIIKEIFESPKPKARTPRCLNTVAANWNPEDFEDWTRRKPKKIPLSATLAVKKSKSLQVKRENVAGSDNGIDSPMPKLSRGGKFIKRKTFAEGDSRQLTPELTSANNSLTLRLKSSLKYSRLRSNSDYSTTESESNTLIPSLNDTSPGKSIFTPTKSTSILKTSKVKKESTPNEEEEKATAESFSLEVKRVKFLESS